MFKRSAGSFFVLAMLLATLVPGGIALAHDDNNNDDDKVKISLSVSNDPEVKALDQQIETARKQLEDLLKKRKELVAQKRGDQNNIKKELRTACRELKSNLREGMQSDEVKLIQELLAMEPGIYTNGQITGFFGPLTKQAIIKFQMKNGLDGVGEIGPRTRALLQIKLKLICGNVNVSVPFPLPTTTPATTTPSNAFKVTVCHKDGTTLTTQEVAISSLLGHIQHGDKVGTCSTTTPPVTDTIAPVLNGLMSTTTTTTGTVIHWTTNEAATSKVWYGTTAGLSGAASIDNSALVTTHDIALTGLSASTTYFYKVESKDATGNTATSAEASFTTKN